MTLGELMDTLQKVRSLVAQGGEDAAVVLRGLEGEAKSVVQRIEVAFNSGTEGVKPEVVVIHGAAPEAPPEQHAEPAPEATAAPEHQPA